MPGREKIKIHELEWCTCLEHSKVSRGPSKISSYIRRYNFPIAIFLFYIIFSSFKHNQQLEKGVIN